MSIEEFKLHYMKENNSDDVYEYVNKNKEKLSKIDDSGRHQNTSFHDDPGRHQNTSFHDDPGRHQNTSFHDDNDLYGIILKTLFHDDMKIFVASGYPWRELFNLKMYRFSWNDVKLCAEDLSDSRMDGCNNFDMYINILMTFLNDHECHDIPESFFDHNINYSYLINSLLLLGTIERSNILFKNVVNKKIITDPKYIEVLCRYFEKYHENHCYRLTEELDQDIVYHAFMDISHYRFDVIGDILNEYYSYKSLRPDKNNFIEIFFDMVKNDTSEKNDTSKIYLDYHYVSNYFQWMTLDEQITFWNIVKDCNEKNNSVVDVMMYSHSELFITYAFDHLPECLEIITRQIDVKRFSITIQFWKIFVQKYPHLKDKIYIYLLLMTDDDSHFDVFQDSSPQDLIKMIRDNLLS